MWSRAAVALVVRRRGCDSARPSLAALTQAARSLCLRISEVRLGGAGGRKAKAAHATDAKRAAVETATPCQDAADGAAEARPTPKRSRRQKRKSGAESADVTLISVDVGEVLREWRALQGQQRDSPSTSTQAGTSGSGRHSAGGLDRAHHEASLTDRAAAMSAILKHQEDFPQLHTLFFFDKDTDELTVSSADRNAVAEQFDLSLAGTDDVVRCEADVAELLSLLRVYRQLSRRSAWMAKVLRRLTAAVLAGLADAWRAEPQTAVKHSIALVLLELRRSQFSHQQTERKAVPAPPPPAADNPQRRVRGRKPADAGEWPAVDVDTFLQNTVAAVAAAIAAAAAAESASTGRGPAQLRDCLTDYALLSLAADVADAAAANPTALAELAETAAALRQSAATWRATSHTMRKRMESVLAAYRALNPSKLTSEDGSGAVAQQQQQQQSIDDVLDALLTCQRFELAIALPVRQALHSDAILILQRVCQAVGTEPELFLLICHPSFSAKLEHLRDAPGGLFEQLCTDAFSAAATFLTVSGPARVHTLMEQREASRGGGTAAAPRPPLHSPLSQLCYALLCAGFAPDAVLSSGLAIALSAVDLADITNAAALFSAAFATRPLPVRIHTALTDEAVALAKRALVLSQRVVQTATDVLMDEAAGLAPLAARVEAGGTATATAPARPLRAAPPPRELTPIQKKRVKYVKKLKAQAALEQQTGRKTPLSSITLTDAGAPAGEAAMEADSGGGGGLLGVATKAEADMVTSQAAYICAAALVECLSRGDVASAGRVMQSFSALLELTGSTAYLVEAAELVTGRVRARLAAAGSLEASLAGRPRSPAPLSPTQHLRQERAAGATTAQMEEAFTEFACALQARLSDNVLRRTAKEPAAHGGGRGAGQAPHPPVRAASSVHRTPLAVGKEEADALQKLVLRFAVCALTLGMKMSFHEQLTTLLATLRAARGPPSAEKDAAAAAKEVFQVARQLDQLMDGLAHSRLPIARHPQSTHVRTSGIALSRIVAVQLHATASATAALVSRQQPSSVAADAATGKRQRHLVLSVVHLLYRLSVDYPTVAEPAKLRAYRTATLDPALSLVLATDHAASALDASAALPLSTLTEVAVVMCVRHTIHHVSHELYEGLAASVVHAARGLHGLGYSHTTSALAQRLLCAAATICLRTNDALTSLFADMAAALEPSLGLKHAVTVLDTARELRVPPTAAPVMRLRARLTDSLSAVVAASAAAPSSSAPAGGAGEEAAAAPAPATAKRPQMAVSDMIAILHTLCQHDEAPPASSEGRLPDSGVFAIRGSGKASHAPVQRVPYGAVFLRLCRPEVLRRRTLSLHQCGSLVHVAASLAARPDVLAACTAEERACILQLPRVMAVAALQAPQQGIERDIPAILGGYAAVQDGALRAQVMRAYISRTIRACPALAPAEVVACVEAYCTAGIYHEYLFSVLLGRVADVTQAFSLGLSLRLLRCGVEAKDAQVRLACLTAAQPVFVSHVRHVLQSDPQQLVTVGATSATILACLRVCFPHDPISAAVLDNIATHHRNAEVGVLKAALELVAARGSKDYAVLRTLADYCTSEVMPTCDADNVAEVAYLLARCGVRSSALVTAAAARFQQVAGAASGHALARLALALETACVDADQPLMEAMAGRVTELVDSYLDAVEASAAVVKKARRKQTEAAAAGRVEPPLTVEQAVGLLRHLRVAGRLHYALVVPAIDALLSYLQTLWAQTEAPTATTTSPAATSTARVGEATLDPTSATATDRYTPACMSLADVEVVLGACVESASEPRRHTALVRRCATQLVDLLSPSPAAASATQVAPGRPSSPEVLRADLSQLTNLVNHLVRASTSTGSEEERVLHDESSPAFRAAQTLFSLLYERRGALLKRHLLLDTTRQTLTTAGREVHPALYGLVVENKLS